MVPFLCVLKDKTVKKTIEQYNTHIHVVTTRYSVENCSRVGEKKVK